MENDEEANQNQIVENELILKIPKKEVANSGNRVNTWGEVVVFFKPEKAKCLWIKPHKR